MGIIFKEKPILDPYSIYIPKKNFEDLIEFANEDIACELLNGVLIIHSPASFIHESIFKFLIWQLESLGKKYQLGIPIGSRFSMKLSSEWAPEPDIMFLSAADQERLNETYLEGPASVVFEILSLSTREDNLEKKLPFYLKSGVKEVWIIDPENKLVQIYWPDLDPITIAEGWADSKEISGFSIDVDWLWNTNSINELDTFQEIETRNNLS